MRIISKTKAILLDNSAESIAEVLVAFLVLSIVMVLFAQGLRYATSAETNAIDNTKACDDSLIRLQKAVIGLNPEGVGSEGVTPENLDGGIKSPGELVLTKYYVTSSEGGDTNTFIYYVFDAKVKSDE